MKHIRKTLSGLARGTFDERLPGGVALPLTIQQANVCLARQRSRFFCSSTALVHFGFSAAAMIASSSSRRRSRISS